MMHCSWKKVSHADPIISIIPDGPTSRPAPGRRPAGVHAGERRHLDLTIGDAREHPELGFLTKKSCVKSEVEHLVCHSVEARDFAGLSNCGVTAAPCLNCFDCPGCAIGRRSADVGPQRHDLPHRRRRSGCRRDFREEDAKDAPARPRNLSGAAVRIRSVEVNR